MENTKELKYHFNIARELYSIKNRFEKETDEEWFFYMAKAYETIIFSNDGQYNFSNSYKVGDWDFKTKKDKKEMLDEIDIAFTINNEHLAKVYHEHLIQSNLKTSYDSIPNLLWGGTDSFHVWDGQVDLFPWLSGQCEYIEFTDVIRKSQVFNKSFPNLMNELTDMSSSEELIQLYIEANTGISSLDEIPINILIALESLDNWIAQNRKK